MVDDEVREKVAALVAFASLPENLYQPGPGATVPGDNPKHVTYLNDFRCVFSVTKMDGVWRHLSISIMGSERLPVPIMAEEMARLFGFTGEFTSWRMTALQNPSCVILAQPYE